MLERYTADGRQAIALAHQEARALRSGAIGPGHLLLGVLGTIALLVPLNAGDVRVRIGVGDGPGDGELPFTGAPSAPSRPLPTRPSASGTSSRHPPTSCSRWPPIPRPWSSAGSTRRACATRRCST